MFKDESFEPINVFSDLKEEKYVRDQIVQTRTISFEDKSSQSVLKNDIDIQTEFQNVLPQSTRIKIDNSKDLSKFMLRVYPLISEQLLANVRSRAFDGYEVDWEEAGDNEETENLYKLHDKSFNADLAITCVDWNCTGSVIAAAFGSINHEAWCIHNSVIKIWNINRTNLDESKADKLIDTDCCILSITFNSIQPAILAGGDFSGKILIWDISKEENMLVAYTGKDIASHQEAVTQIAWGNQKGTRSFELISVGSDGKILFWEYNQLKMKLQRLKRFILTAQSIPRAFRNGLSKSDLSIGISCFTKKLNKILIGTEGGGVFQCYTEGANSLTKMIGDEKYEIPIVKGFKGHSATVTSIVAVDEKIFATCSIDTMLHVYNSENKNPLIEIEPGLGSLLDMKWYPERPTVIAVATSTGSVLIYDFNENTSAPISTITQDKVSVNTLSFNKDRSSIVATGDNETLSIWKLPNSLSVSKLSEESFYSSFIED